VNFLDWIELQAHLSLAWDALGKPTFLFLALALKYLGIGAIPLLASAPAWYLPFCLITSCGRCQ
jgi:hypothetical protein